MFKRITKQHMIGGGVALVIMLVALAVICGAWRSSHPKTIPIENPTEIYTQAVSAFQNTPNLYYEVNGTISFTESSNILEESFEQFITINAQNSEDMRIRIEETSHIGDYDIQRFDFYDTGTEYLTVQGASFYTSVSPADFCEKFVPLVMFDPALYMDIIGVTVGRESTIRFQTPVAMETWSATGGELITAEGSVVLNQDNALVSSTYTASYRRGTAVYTVHYEAKFIESAPSPIQLPNTDAYLPIDDIDAPYLLEKACGYLMNSNNLRAQYSDTITCQAFGDERKKEVTLTIAADSDGWNASAETTVSVTNSSKTGATTSSKSEKFKNGVYTAAIDSEPYTENPDVDLTAMDSYCDNLLIGTILLPEYILTAKSEQIEDITSITFDATSQFAKLLATEACTVLYQTETILDDLAENSTINTMTCYLNINTITGFPVSSGFNYEGTYLISDLPYALSFKADQSYTQAEEIQSETAEDPTEESTDITEPHEAETP